MTSLLKKSLAVKEISSWGMTEGMVVCVTSSTIWMLLLLTLFIIRYDCNAQETTQACGTYPPRNGNAPVSLLQNGILVIQYL